MTHKIAITNETCIAYADYGDKQGYPILIQHGLIASIDEVELFQGLLDLGTRLICMARPGYGASSPYELRNIAGWGELVSVLVDNLELPQFDILGLSSGAPYSYAAGFRFPDQVRNIFILSGIPALYDEKILSYWPYPDNKNASLAEMQALAYELFFFGLSEDELVKPALRDSMMNHCFGIAQDLQLRSMDWGFRLSEVRVPVTMQHCKADPAVPFITAELTARLLPNCKFEGKEEGAHFSYEILDDFIRTRMAPHYHE
jgi:pimeloyl-ACP methyl ester carboxylesterase